jgi:hypothetical protein
MGDTEGKLVFVALAAPARPSTPSRPQYARHAASHLVRRAWMRVGGSADVLRWAAKRQSAASTAGSDGPIRPERRRARAQPFTPPIGNVVESKEPVALGQRGKDAGCG